MQEIKKEFIINNIDSKKIRLDKYLSFCFEIREIILDEIINKKYSELLENKTLDIVKLKEEILKDTINISEYSNNLDVKEIIEDLIEEYGSYITRSKLQKLIENNEILVNNNLVLPSYSLKNNDLIIVNLNVQPKTIITDETIKEFKNYIVFENEDILVVNKPKGLIVHSGVNTEITLEKILLKYFENTKVILPGEKGRKGIVHRLDKDTSGIMVIAKNEKSYINLVNQFKNRETKKRYRAIVRGSLEKDFGTINMPISRDIKNRHKMCVDINGKEAITNFTVIKRSSKYTYLDVEILTGRTHQIRVHMANIGHPIIGDFIYSNGKNDLNIQGQVLQSYYLEIFDPSIINEKDGEKEETTNSQSNNDSNINQNNNEKRIKLGNFNKEVINTVNNNKLKFELPESEEILRVLNEF